jgi:DNA-binding transcriptional ArsR family regulator
MNKKREVITRSEPFWLLEAMNCMNYVDTLDSDTWLNQNSSWSRRQKEEFLQPYRIYREAMREKLQPLFERYPLILGYVDLRPREVESLRSYDPPLISFLMQMQDVLEAEEMPSQEVLEKRLHNAFARILEADLQKSAEVEEVKIGTLSDLMAALEGWDGDDADKFKLLRLYSERREVMDQLWELKAFCEEIGRSCLNPVKERLAAFMEQMKKPGEVTALLEEAGFQCGESFCMEVCPAVMRYNGIMLQARSQPDEEPSGCLKIRIGLGIETFYMLGSRKRMLRNDSWLPARMKALGDPTRIRILHQLAERPCYLQEMAKELGLTPATVLHHLGILLSEDLIGVMVMDKKKRVYYQIKKQGFEEASQGILELAKPSREREETDTWTTKK